MNSHTSLLLEQYEYVKSSRKALFEYCESLSPADLINANSSFGRGGSIRNLLVHIANTYKFWIGQHGLNKEIIYSDYDSVKNIDEIITLFDEVNSLMAEFINKIQLPEFKEVLYTLNGVNSSAPPFKLFTHVLTHEYHHKGQVLSLSRHLGYIPVDTDVLR